MMIKVSDIQFYPIKLNSVRREGLSADLVSSRSSFDLVIVKVITDSSLVGFGEVISRSGSSSSGLMNVLKASAKALIGSDILNPNAMGRTFDDAIDDIRTTWSAVGAAFEMASFDLMGKARGVPAYSVLGGQYRTNLERSALLADVAPEEAALQAKKRIKEGFCGLKMSSRDGNRSAEQDLNTVLAVLDAVESDIHLNVLVGNKWENAEQVTSFFSSLLSDSFFGNVSVEQPLSPLDLDGLAKLREILPVSVVLSESVSSPDAMVQIAHHAAADRITLNISRVGGLSQAQKIVHICDAAAIGVSVCAPVGSRLGLSAHTHLASTIRDPLPIDIGNSLAPEREPFSGGFDMMGGRLVLGDQPGLGVDLNEDVLRAMVVNT